MTKQLCDVMFYFHWSLCRSDTFYQFIQTLLRKSIHCIFRRFSLILVNMASAYLTNECDFIFTVLPFHSHCRDEN